MTGIDGKVIAVTGASDGIGAATAELLAARGARMVLGARRVERLAEVAQRITDAGGAAAFVQTDVTRRADLSGLVALARSRFGRLDVLVGNAGIGPISPFADLHVEEWEAMIDVNLKGVLYGIAAALPIFRAQGEGHFINVVSVAGLAVRPSMAVYGATKNAVRTISEGLRQESGGAYRVTVVSPGFVQTGFTDAIPNAQVRESLAAVKDRIAIPATSIGEAIAYAIGQPAAVDVNDIAIRATAQD
jgi:NADP-dependent 3-hydroxy acid dehydrogenase YdfG